MSSIRANAPHVAVGICFVLLGVSLILDRLGVLEITRVLEYWPLALVLLGLSLVVQATHTPAHPGQARGGFPGGAFILLVIVTFLARGAFEHRSTEVPPERTVMISSIFAGQHATVTETFQAADITSVMGGSELDLRQATIPTGEVAVIDLFALMGGAIVRVPAHWVVDVQSTIVMAGVKDERNPRNDEDDRPERPSRRPERERDVETRRDRALPPLPVVPELSALTERSGATESVGQADSPEPPPAPVPAAAPPGGPPAPRLVVRGFIMMGGLTIKP